MFSHKCTYAGNVLATRTDGNPIHASQVIRPSVLTLPNINVKAAAMATNIAVHAPWVETAFKPIEIPSIAEPVTNTQYA